jgi:hypothetical protein
MSSITIVNVMPKFGASFTVVSYTPRLVSYAANNFIIQAMWASAKKTFYNRHMKIIMHDVCTINVPWP